MKYIKRKIRSKLSFVTRFVTEIGMLKHSSQYRKAFSSEATRKISLTFVFIVVFYVMGANFFMGNEKEGGIYGVFET